MWGISLLKALVKNVGHPVFPLLLVNIYVFRTGYLFIKSRFVHFLNLSNQLLLLVKGSVFDASGISCFLIPHVNLQLLLFNSQACRNTVLYTVNKRCKNPFHFNNVRPSCIYSYSLISCLFFKVRVHHTVDPHMSMAFKTSTFLLFQYVWWCSTLMLMTSFSHASLQKLCFCAVDSS